MHCHPNKSTSLVVLSGEVECCSLKERNTLFKLDSVVIDKGCFHSTEAISDIKFDASSENGVWIMEIESPSNKHDLVRANDHYGRVGKSYESSENLIKYSSDWLKLKNPDLNEKVLQKQMGCIFNTFSGDNLIKNGN